MTTIQCASPVVIVKFGNRKKDVAAMESFKDCSLLCIKYIEYNNLGGSTWRGGDVFDVDGNKIARISYNGRIWDNNDNEIFSA